MNVSNNLQHDNVTDNQVCNAQFVLYIHHIITSKRYFLWKILVKSQHSVFINVTRVIEITDYYMDTWIIINKCWCRNHDSCWWNKHFCWWKEFSLRPMLRHIKPAELYWAIMPVDRRENRENVDHQQVKSTNPQATQFSPSNLMFDTDRRW